MEALSDDMDIGLFRAFFGATAYTVISLLADSRVSHGTYGTMVNSFNDDSVRSNRSFEWF